MVIQWLSNGYPMVLKIKYLVFLKAFFPIGLINKKYIGIQKALYKYCPTIYSSR